MEKRRRASTRRARGAFVCNTVRSRRCQSDSVSTVGDRLQRGSIFRSSLLTHKNHYQKKKKKLLNRSIENHMFRLLFPASITHTSSFQSWTWNWWIFSLGKRWLQKTDWAPGRAMLSLHLWKVICQFPLKQRKGFLGFLSISMSILLIDLIPHRFF